MGQSLGGWGRGEQGGGGECECAWFPEKKDKYLGFKVALITLTENFGEKHTIYFYINNNQNNNDDSNHNNTFYSTNHSYKGLTKNMMGGGGGVERKRQIMYSHNS